MKKKLRTAWMDYKSVATSSFRQSNMKNCQSTIQLPPKLEMLARSLAAYFSIPRVDVEIYNRLVRDNSTKSILLSVEVSRVHDSPFRRHFSSWYLNSVQLSFFFPSTLWHKVKISWSIIITVTRLFLSLELLWGNYVLWKVGKEGKKWFLIQFIISNDA